MSPEKLARMYKSISNVCWEYEQYEAANLDTNILINPEDFLKNNIQLKSESFLLGLMDSQMKRSRETLLFYMTMEVRLPPKWEGLTLATMRSDGR